MLECRCSCFALQNPEHWQDFMFWKQEESRDFPSEVVSTLTMITDLFCDITLQHPCNFLQHPCNFLSSCSIPCNFLSQSGNQMLI